MSKRILLIKDILITLIIMCICFSLCLIIHTVFKKDNLISSIFILGVFITSAVTQGYTCGILSSFISVVAVNYAFTFPYLRLNFTIPENLTSAVIMIVIALVTCGFTTRLKRSEIIKAEGMEEKMRANLLRAISHDLRTPLTAIYGASSALLKNKNSFTDEQKEQMLAGISDDALWLSHMVENLLSITKLNSGKVKIIKTPVVLDELIDSSLIKFKKRYPHQQISIDIPDRLITIPMDPILIEQVITNLLENAVKHAHGMKSLTLRVFVISGKAVFEISDDGCGIADTKIKSLFAGNIPSDSQKSNAGIGLSVCATIIKAHGGEIEASNLKHGGCVFRFALDTEENEDDKQQI